MAPTAGAEMSVRQTVAQDSGTTAATLHAAAWQSMLDARFPVGGRRAAQSTRARVEGVQELLERAGQTIEYKPHTHMDRTSPHQWRETMAGNYSQVIHLAIGMGSFF